MHGKDGKSCNSTSSLLDLLQKQMALQKQSLEAQLQTLKLQQSMIDKLTKDGAGEGSPVHPFPKVAPELLQRPHRDEQLPRAAKRGSAWGIFTCCGNDTIDPQLDIREPPTEPQEIDSSMFTSSTYDTEPSSIWAEEAEASWWRVAIAYVVKHPTDHLLLYDLQPSFVDATLAGMSADRFRRMFVSSLEQLNLFLAFMLLYTLPALFASETPHTELGIIVFSYHAVACLLNVFGCMSIFSLCKTIRCIPNHSLIAWAVANRLVFIMLNMYPWIIAWFIVIAVVLCYSRTVALSDARHILFLTSSETHIAKQMIIPTFASVALIFFVIGLMVLQTGTRSAFYAGILSERREQNLMRSGDNAKMVGRRFFGAAACGQAASWSEVLKSYWQRRARAEEEPEEEHSTQTKRDRMQRELFTI